MVKMRKTMWVTCCTFLMGVAGQTFAGIPYDVFQQEVTPKKEIPNPEKAAQKRTDEMDKALNLTEKQYKKIYKLNLKEEREKLEMMLGRMPMGGGDGHPARPMGGERPPMRGGRPDGFGGGPGGNFPPMMGAPLDKEELQKKVAEQNEKKAKKLRKILTEEQYDIWLTMKPEVPVPGEGRPAPHAEGEFVPPMADDAAAE